MTQFNREYIGVLVVLVSIAASLVTATAMYDWDQQKAEAAEQAVAAPYVFPLTKNKMIEIYEQAFYECNNQYGVSVKERHKFAMGAVQTAPSRYNQLMQEIAKHDEN